MNSNTWVFIVLIGLGSLALIAATKGNLDDVISQLFGPSNAPVKGTDTKKADKTPGQFTGPGGPNWTA